MGDESVATTTVLTADSSSALLSMLSAQGLNASGVLGEDGPSLDEAVDLGPYCSSSAPSVPDSFSLERAYMLFQSLGLRHLVVVDAGNRVKGIVTRKVGKLHPPMAQSDHRASRSMLMAGYD